MQRPRMDEKAEKGYREFAAGYAEMKETGEAILKEQVLRTWKLEKFARLKDECVFYLYRNFPELYRRVFVDEPVLPGLPIWHYLLTHALFIPEKWVSPYFWPGVGAQIETYLQYFLTKLNDVVVELENTYEIVLTEPGEESKES